MATTRRRQNSLAGHGRALSIHGGRPGAANKQPTAPKSAHVSDPYLQSFLTPAFDPADYLNFILPPLQSQAPTSRSQDATSLAELSAKAQSEVSQLNAHTTRLINTLTQLTDDILRSGSRLAYEVELLRGETLSLSEALHEDLADDIAQFVPQPTAPKTEAESPAPTPNGTAEATDSLEPAYITQLRTLTLVRERLESVVKTFGDAMEFVFPPSELSVSSSFLSVSAPEPGAEAQSTEDKGQLVLKTMREEINNLISNTNDPVDGLEKATQRLEELKDLSNVWKGTAEEKGRAKFLDSLAKQVEDRHRELVKELEQAGRKTEKNEAATQRKPIAENDASSAENKGNAGYGLMSQWQRLRTGL